MQELKLLRRQGDAEIAYARDVPAWPVEAGDKPKLNRVGSSLEYNRDRRGRRLGCQRRSSATGGNHAHLATNQISGQCWQTIVLALRPAEFDRHVPAFDIPGLVEALAERGHHGRVPVR